MTDDLGEVPSFVTRAVAARPSAAQERANTIFRELRHRICTNRCPPGTILHEAELAEEFGVSRSPIRRVFARLEQTRLLEIRHGVGARVTDVDLASLRDIYSVRMMLAQSMGPYLVSPLPEEAALFLETCIGQFRGLDPGDLHGFGDINTRYFLGMVNLLENECLKALQHQLYYETARMWLPRLPIVDWSAFIERGCDGLEQVAMCIRQNDPDALAFAFRTSIRNGMVATLREV